MSTRGTKVTCLGLGRHLVPKIRLESVWIGTKATYSVNILLRSYICYPLLITKAFSQVTRPLIEMCYKIFIHMSEPCPNQNTASSISLLPLKVSLEKTILFLCCQIVHVSATHQHNEGAGSGNEGKPKRPIKVAFQQFGIE